MEGPRDMIHRAMQQRRMGRRMLNAPEEQVFRAQTVQGDVANARQTAAAPVEPNVIPSAPRTVSRHGTYTALMRSHDRVRTQHIAGRG